MVEDKSKIWHVSCLATKRVAHDADGPHHAARAGRLFSRVLVFRPYFVLKGEKGRKGTEIMTSSDETGGLYLGPIPVAYLLVRTLLN